MAAPATRISARESVERGRSRSANALTRLAANGAAASAATSRGWRPARRAAVGSSVSTIASETPMPTAATVSSDRFRRSAIDGGADAEIRGSTEYLTRSPARPAR